MNSKDALIIIFPFITAVISSYFTYYLTQKSKTKDATVKFREEKYKELLISLQGFVGNTANSETKRKFLNEFYQSWLYCSDEVVETVYNMLDMVMNKPSPQIDREQGREAIGKIVLAMRKDLLGKTDIEAKRFLFIDVNE